MKHIIIIIFFILFTCGVVFITINLTKLNNKCPKVKVIYRYMPKKYLDQQYNENMASDIFKNMFTMVSPWVSGNSERDFNKMENVNKYFVSQV